ARTSDADPGLDDAGGHDRRCSADPAQGLRPGRRSAGHAGGYWPVALALCGPAFAGRWRDIGAARHHTHREYLERGALLARIPPVAIQGFPTPHGGTPADTGDRWCDRGT